MELAYDIILIMNYYYCYYHYEINNMFQNFEVFILMKMISFLIKYIIIQKYLIKI